MKNFDIYLLKREKLQIKTTTITIIITLECAGSKENSRQRQNAFYYVENIDGRAANDEQCSCSFALYAFTIFIISVEFEIY